MLAAVAWVLFVPAADWLAHHDVGSAKGPLSPDRMRQAIDRAFSESPDCPEIAPGAKTGL